MVESHVTVMTSLFILFSSPISLFLDDYNYASGRALPRSLEGLVDLLQRKPRRDMWLYDAGFEQADRLHHVLPGPVARADDLELPLRNLDGVDGRELRLFAD